jgi:hypothetical protein
MTNGCRGFDNGERKQKRDRSSNQLTQFIAKGLEERKLTHYNDNINDGMTIHRPGLVTAGDDVPSPGCWE